MKSSELIVNMKNLSKTFFTEEVESTVLKNIDLEIKKGEFVMLNGPSGCGKSTLLSIVGLLDFDFDGDYQFNGVEVKNLNQKEKAGIRNSGVGFIFQSFNLISDMTVYENIELPLSYRFDLSSKEKKDLVNNALEKLGILHRANHYPHQLSGGQQQRVAVARAVVCNPVLLLADEPTGNLDSVHGDEVMKLLSDLHSSGTSILMVTHDPRYSEWAERVINVIDGKIQP